MKKIVTFTLLTLWLCGSILAQMPLPCLRYENSNITSLQSFNGSKSTECLQIDMYAAPVHLNDNNVREYTVGEGHIEPGFSYTPTSPTAGLNITLGTNSEMQGAWFEPINYFPQLYEKIEWGVKLPDAVEQAIDNWIHNDQFPLDPPLTPALNPFDPEQIDLKADISWNVGSVNHQQPVFGFFYQPFTRNTTSQNKNVWDWDLLSNDYTFRIRWAATNTGIHSVIIRLDVPGFGNWELLPFEFIATSNDPSNSFVSITPNKHYFGTDDGKVFFPVGRNIYNHCYDCGCDIGVQENANNPAPCSTCYADQGDANICCGLNFNNRQSNYKGFHDNLRESCLPLASYLRLEEVLQEHANVGANAFRFLMYPAAMDIEFEKMNNYYDRQYQAWEMDQMLETCHDLGLRIELNMQDHVTITNKLFGNDRWDFYTDDTCGDDNQSGGDHGWCYKSGCSLSSPSDFFEIGPPGTPTCAELNFKKKLRYFISRFGYSPNIFMIEFFSEVNSVNQIQNMACNPTVISYYSGDWTNPDSLHIRKRIGDWHIEMARFIKEDLFHTNHLLAGNYIANAPMNTFVGYNDPCDSPNHDGTWESDYIDVISNNTYGSRSDKYKWLAGDHNRSYDFWAYNTCAQFDAAPLHQDLGHGFLLTTKPVVLAETGFMGEYFNCDLSGFQRDLIAIPFAGLASCGMSWDEARNSTTLGLMGSVNSFLKSRLFDAFDLGVEEWVPRYAVSENQQSEAMALVSPDRYNIVGAIMNRTYNGYSLENHLDNIINNCDSLVGEGDPILPIRTFTVTNFGNNEIKFSAISHPDDQFSVEIINPFNLETIAYYEGTFSSTEPNLLRVFYPDLPIEMPFCYFIASGNNWSANMPMMVQNNIDLSASHTINSKTSASQNNAELSSHINNTNAPSATNAFPNPCVEGVYLKSLAEPNEKFDIFDSLGNLIYSGQLKGGLSYLNTKEWTCGFYHVRFNKTGQNVHFVKS